MQPINKKTKIEQLREKNSRQRKSSDEGLKRKRSAIYNEEKKRVTDLLADIPNVELDLTTIEAYAKAYSEVVYYEALTEKYGDTTVNQKGDVVISAYSRLLQQRRCDLRNLSKELMLTPSSRKEKVNSQKEETLSDIFND